MKLGMLPTAKGATATWYYEVGFTSGAGKLSGQLGRDPVGLPQQ